MTDVNLTPDEIIYFQYGDIVLNATIVNTWIVMAFLIISGMAAAGCAFSMSERRKKGGGRKLLPSSSWQNGVETLIETIREQIREMMGRDPDPYLPFIGSLFLYIFFANVLSIVPGYESPTGSIATTSALAVCVFFAVPIYGIAENGLAGYLKHYLDPSPVMLPFNIISELSRTLALAVRLFGNIMSGTLIVGVLLSIAPLFVPLIMQALGLIIGVIQAYIFAALSTIYIASAVKARESSKKKKEKKSNQGSEQKTGPGKEE